MRTVAVTVALLFAMAALANAQEAKKKDKKGKCPQCQKHEQGKKAEKKKPDDVHRMVEKLGREVLRLRKEMDALKKMLKERHRPPQKKKRPNHH